MRSLAFATLVIVSGATAATVPQIPWDPSMVGAVMVYEAANPASVRNVSGNQAAPGELVARWNDRNGADFVANATVANQPTLASDTDGLNSPSGVRPLKFRSSHALFNSALARTAANFDIFILARLRGGSATNSQTLVGNSVGSFKTLVFQSVSANPGALRAGVSELEVSTAERLRLIRARSSNNSLYGSLNGAESHSLPSVRDAFSSSYAIVGNWAGTKAQNGANMDLFAFSLVPSELTRANAQRMEGYLAWRAGLEALLVAGHPYRDAPPTVPVGTVSTLAWLDLNTASESAIQTWRGPMCEVQADSYNGGTSPPIDGTTDVWGIPYSLTPAEQARLKAEYFPGDGTGYMYLRFPLGFAYRGIRAVDPGSGLGTQIGERYAGQNAALRNMISAASAAGGGLFPEYWSPAPHFKTTGSYGYGTLCAGGNYARTVTLDSIRSNDPAQYAAQIDRLAAAMVNDLEYLHQNVGPVRGFAPQNEAFNPEGARYGTCTYDSAELYADVSRVVFAKIDASTVLATYNGQPNTVWGMGPSWKAMPTSVTNDPTLYGRFWAVAQHNITLLSQDGDKAKSIYQAPGGKQTIDNEFEYFTTPSQGREWQFANTALVQAVFMARYRAETHNPMIHIAKQLGQTSAGSNTDGYGVVAVRLPFPFSGHPTDPGDLYPSLSHGAYINQGWNSNAVKTFADHIVAGSTIQPRFYPGTIPTGTETVAFRRPDSKVGCVVVNRNSTALPLTVGLSGNRSVKILRYGNTHEGTLLDQVTSSAVSVTVPAYNALVIVEDTGGAGPIAPVITSSGTASGTTNVPFNYQITADHSPVSFGAINLPQGLTVNASTGLISGTPTIAATSSIGLSATNTAGTGTRSLLLTISSSGSLPSPWAKQDVGIVTPAGSATYANGTFTIVTGYGLALINPSTSDKFTYLHQPAHGDCSITAHVASLACSDAIKGEAGVMIRESLANNSAFALTGITTGRGIQFSRRASTGATSTSTAGPSGVAPQWLRITRVGDVFTAYRSTDNITWTQVGTPQTIPMAASVFIGLPLCNHGGTGTSTIDNVTATP